MIALNEYVTRSSDVVWRVYDGEVVIMNEDGSQIHQLNKVASFIWELADGTLTVDDIITRIYDRFEVERDVAQADAIEFIQQLVEKGLIQLSKHTQVET